MPYQAGTKTSLKQDFHAVVGAPGSPQPSFTTLAGEVDGCPSATGAIYRGQGQSQRGEGGGARMQGDDEKEA